MNDHEAERIAAAMHELRPDWPTSSLLTLIRKNLLTKPRRDVTVALAWVACESNTHTPARVLETGPWWKASAAETGGAGRSTAGNPPWCKNCACGQDAPIHSSGECEFTLWPEQILAEEARLSKIAELRALNAENRAGPLLVAVKDEPTACGVGDCIRSAAHTGPHQGPPEPEPQPEGEPA